MASGWRLCHTDVTKWAHDLCENYEDKLETTEEELSGGSSGLAAAEWPLAAQDIASATESLGAHLPVDRQISASHEIRS